MSPSSTVTNPSIVTRSPARARRSAAAVFTERAAAMSTKSIGPDTMRALAAIPVEFDLRPAA